MVNFRLPYFARTPSEFWRGWHISLSTWLRDYLYVPLGGNRQSVAKTYRNLTLTMLLGGLWHGASWTFIVWGAYQGLILVLYRIAHVDEWIETRTRTGFYGHHVQHAAGYCHVLVGRHRVAFLSGGIDDRGLGLRRPVESALTGALGSWAVLLSHIAPLVLVQVAQKRSGELELLSLNTGIVGITLKALLIYGLLFLSAKGGQQFIYFDF